MKIAANAIISNYKIANSNPKIHFGQRLKRDCFMKQNREQNPACPKSVSQSDSDTEGMKMVRAPFYACDVEKMKEMSSDERIDYIEKLAKEHKQYNPDKIADIYSGGNQEEARLSNFSRSSFVFDGVQIASMEGLLQSLKTSDANLQEQICSMKAKDAKIAGHEIKEFDGETLWWKGKPINRLSSDYQEFLDKAYDARFEQDEKFRNALELTKNKELIHTIGCNDPSSTVLTTDEFIGQLTRLQEGLR